MKKYKVSLNFQCNKDWNKMIPMDHGSALAGRHCEACNKIVVDFSSMTDSDIVNYLLQNKNACGKFHPTQLDRTYTIYPIKNRKSWPAIAAMMVAGMFSIAIPDLNAAKHSSYDVTTVHGGVAVWEEPAPPHSKVDPEKIGKIQFTVRLFDQNSKNKISNGSITIAGLGTFQSNTQGDIVIYFSGDGLPEIIEASIYSSLGHHYYKISRKDLKNSTHADLYLTEMIMPAGTVAIEEQ
jgi:hypothetical protein